MKKPVCDYCDAVIEDRNFDMVAIEGHFNFRKGNKNVINRDGDTHFCNTDHMLCWLRNRLEQVRRE